MSNENNSDEAPVGKRPKPNPSTIEEEKGDSDNNYQSRNHYAGWTVPTKDYMIPTINIADVTPEIFYNDYIKQRRPVVLVGGLPSDLSQIEHWKDIDCWRRYN